jgi:hypothetical protein
MRLPIPRPRHVVGVARQGFRTIEWMITLGPRIAVLVNQVEQIVARLNTLLSNVELTERRVSTVATGIERTHEQVRAVVTRAGETMIATDVIVADAALVTARVGPLLDAYQPALDQLQPIVARVAETTSPTETDAMVALIDTLPGIVRKLDSDILPILDTLGTVAPDLRDLLDASKELNEMLGALPGLGRIRKRVEEQQRKEDEYRADARANRAAAVENCTIRGDSGR